MLVDQDLADLVTALRIGKYERVAVQVHDSRLSDAPTLVKQLQKELPLSNVSLLGDSVTECCLDEVAAEHYGSDCIVKLGHCCWFASQRIVAFFLSGTTSTADELCESFQSARKEQSAGSIIVFVESMKDLSSIMQLPCEQLHDLYICLSPCVSYPGSNKSSIKWFTTSVAFSSVALRPISRHFQSQKQEYPRVSGRLIFRLSDSSFEQILDPREVSLLVDTPSTRFIVNQEGSLLSRVVNRFGTQAGRVVSSPDTLGINQSYYKELL